MAKKKIENKTNQSTGIYYLILFLVTAGVYLNALQNDFVFDDESVVQGDHSITQLSSIPKYFTAQEGFHKIIGKYYRPVVSTTYALDYALWGLNAKGFHFTNILIHLIATLLLFAILKTLFANYKYGLLFALMSALLFGVHTIHTEAVTWVSGRTDTMVTMFFFASFLFYIKFTSEESKTNLLIYSFFFYLLGLLSKEMIVTMPVFVLLYDFVYRKKPISYIKENYKTYLGFTLITVLFVVLRALLLNGVPDREKYMYFFGFNWSTVIPTMLKTIPIYFKLLFLPINLLYHYNGVLPDSNSYFDIKVLFSIIFILALLVISVYNYKNNSPVSFAILFFLVSLTPVMNIVPTMSLMAERFLYLGTFSLSIVILYLAVKFAKEDNRKILLTGFVVIILILSFLTIRRNADWKDNNTLYSTADGVDGSVLLVNAGNIYGNNKNYDEAEKRYRRAIELRSNNVLAHHNLGLIYLIKGNLDSAEIMIKQGIAIDSLAPDGYMQLANVYQKKGENTEAIIYLEKLQTIVPDYRGSLSVLEQLKSQEGMDPRLPVDQSITQAQIFIKRSYQYYQEKKYDLAIKDLEMLVGIDPNGKSGYLNNIALCYNEIGNDLKAEEFYKQAIAADSKNINALSGLAELELKKGNKSNAIKYYNDVLKINPQNNNALMKLDSLKK